MDPVPKTFTELVPGQLVLDVQKFQVYALVGQTSPEATL